MSFFYSSPTTKFYTLSLHDALPISELFEQLIASKRVTRFTCRGGPACPPRADTSTARPEPVEGDRKSTRLNSSHRCISYAVFCLKKKRKNLAFNIFQVARILRYEDP